MRKQKAAVCRQYVLPYQAWSERYWGAHVLKDRLRKDERHFIKIIVNIIIYLSLMSIGILTTRLYMDRIAALDGKDKKSGNETQGNVFRSDAACWKQTCIIRHSVLLIFLVTQIILSIHHHGTTRLYMD
jgi:hypothetical protein